jgi:hypothetical protein
MLKLRPKQLPPITICKGNGFFDEFDGVKIVKLNPFLSSIPKILGLFSICS